MRPGKHSVDDTQLAKELLQLGLPKGAARPHALTPVFAVSDDAPALPPLL